MQAAREPDNELVLMTRRKEKLEISLAWATSNRFLGVGRYVFYKNVKKKSPLTVIERLQIPGSIGYLTIESMGMFILLVSMKLVWLTI